MANEPDKFTQRSTLETQRLQRARAEQDQQRAAKMRDLAGGPVIRHMTRNQRQGSESK
jgi:hypothetical protein